MIHSLNQILSFLLELGILTAFCYTGFHLDVSPGWQYVSGIGVPIMVLIFEPKRWPPKPKNKFQKEIQISPIFIFFISLLNSSSIKTIHEKVINSCRSRFITRRL